jgi:hypothetical protein
MLQKRATLKKEKVALKNGLIHKYQHGSFCSFPPKNQLGKKIFSSSRKVLFHD